MAASSGARMYRLLLTMHRVFQWRGAAAGGNKRMVNVARISSAAELCKERERERVRHWADALSPPAIMRELQFAPTFLQRRRRRRRRQCG